MTEFVWEDCSSSRSLGRKWEDMILPGCENPCNCVDPDEMKLRWCLSTPGSPEYVLPVAQCTSVTPVSLYTRRRWLTMYLEVVVERVEGCTWRPWSSKFGDALWGRDWARLGMHSEAMIEGVWRCNWRPWSCELGGCDRANLEAVIKRVWRCTLRLWSWTQRWTARPWLSDFGDALAAYDRARLEEYLEAADLEGGATAAENLSIGQHGILGR